MLDLLHIDFVVFGVRANKSDVDYSVRIVDFYNQPIVVSLDIEHHATALDDACTPILLFHLYWIVPIVLFHFAIPRQQRFLCLWKSLPKDAQGAFRNDSHDRT